MTYKDKIVEAMEMLGQQPEVCFVGYNLCPAGGSAGGSLKNVPQEKIFEAPLAENLMSGAAIGMSLDGRIPVLFFERMDFILCGLDAIVNHLNHLAALSEGLHRPAVIIRVVVGNKYAPLFTGRTHVQNFTEAMQKMVQFPVMELKTMKSIQQYWWALDRARAGTSTMLVEFKDLYNLEA